MRQYVIKNVKDTRGGKSSEPEVVAVIPIYCETCKDYNGKGDQFVTELVVYLANGCHDNWLEPTTGG